MGIKDKTWEPDNWHGFDYSDAYPVPPSDVQRMIECTIGFDLHSPAFVIAGDAAVAIATGDATLSHSGDTLILRVRREGGDETVYDCKVRRLWHPRREGCAR